MKFRSISTKYYRPQDRRWRCCQNYKGRQECMTAYSMHLKGFLWKTTVCPFIYIVEYSFLDFLPGPLRTRLTDVTRFLSFFLSSHNILPVTITLEPGQYLIVLVFPELFVCSLLQHCGPMSQTSQSSFKKAFFFLFSFLLFFIISFSIFLSFFLSFILSFFISLIIFSFFRSFFLSFFFVFFLSFVLSFFQTILTSIFGSEMSSYTCKAIILYILVYSSVFPTGNKRFFTLVGSGRPPISVRFGTHIYI